MPNKRLASWARHNLKAKHVDNKKPGLCAGYAREAIWDSYGEESEVSPPRGLDANQQYQWFHRRGYAVPLDEGTQVGDLLYKFGGRHGHVGIRIVGNRVAENATVHGIGDNDARGTRSLVDFGLPQGIVRLPENVES